MRHATDPDHVIAVTTIVSKQRCLWKAGLIGALWGMGHTFTIFLVGAAIICFRLAIPARLGLAMELAVGLMLVLLGVLNLTGLLRPLTERFTPSGAVASDPPETSPMSGPRADPHAGGKLGHTHGPIEVAAEGWLDRTLQGVGFYQVLRPVLIGIVHGLAGSAAIALLVMTTIRNPWWAVGYLLVFGLGTIMGMMLITTVIALPFAYTAIRFHSLNRGLAAASGLLSLCFGLFLSYQIGIVDGLFTSHPQWTPH